MRSQVKARSTHIIAALFSRSLCLLPPFAIAAIVQVRPTGRTKALLVGINYHGSAAELRGCINDVHKMRSFLVSMGFSDSPANMVVRLYVFVCVCLSNPTAASVSPNLDPPTHSRSLFPARALQYLTDDTRDQTYLPTRANIIKGLQWCVLCGTAAAGLSSSRWRSWMPSLLACKPLFPLLCGSSLRLLCDPQAGCRGSARRFAFLPLQRPR